VSAHNTLMVSGLVMLVCAYRIAKALGRNEFPWLHKAYTPYSIAHYGISAIASFLIASSAFDWPLLFVLPGLFCLHALYCSNRLAAAVRRLQVASTLQNDARAASVHAIG
jgi:hypothetical protein